MIPLLLWALNPTNPYGYYVILRYICSAAFAYLTLQAKRNAWAWAFGVVAIIYNPFFRVHLDRNIWSIVNLVTVGLAIGSIFLLKISTEGSDR